MLAPPAGVKLLRRISTKLVVAVLTTVILPFVAFAFFINEQMAERLTRHVVQQSLLSMAEDLGRRLDALVEQRDKDLALWAESPLSLAALNDHAVERARQRRIENGERDVPPPLAWDADLAHRYSTRTLTGSERARMDSVWTRAECTAELNRFVDLKDAYDLFLLVDDHGELVTCSTRNRHGKEGRSSDDEPEVADEQAVLSTAFLERLFRHDFSQEAWFTAAMRGNTYRQNHHGSPWRLREYVSRDKLPRNYHLGFADPVRAASGEIDGVLYALVNWDSIQGVVNDRVVADSFRGYREQDPSPYAWIWASDANTIYAHDDATLYYTTVESLGLPQLVTAVRESEEDSGLYPEYEFRGYEKNAAFKKTAPPERGGFGWVVGVGINNEDIYATADELRALLLGGTALVLLVAVGWTFVIAKRTTGPILDLQRSVRRVAGGDLDSRADTRSKDELGALAEDFNSMTRELKSQREQLIKAEKDAAWREMARQIAHDIKNPLTPIKLSLDLLERVRRENAPGSEEILERTMALMNRQVEHLREIAGDFYEFTGGRRPSPTAVDLGELLDEVLHLHDAWAVRQGVAVQREGGSVVVWGDRAKLQRVFVNLVSNALQAMPDGGELLIDVRAAEGMGMVEIRDTGVGIPDEALEHLFEPYFTTKSEGTGLGLAISRRVVEESGGSIELSPRHASEGRGTVAYVSLPLYTGDETA